METTSPAKAILKILLKDFTISPTITSLSCEVGMSRVGMWKILKRLEKERLVTLSPIGAGKTSAYTVALNWNNPLTEKSIALSLAEDALNNQRWLTTFADLENMVDFLMIYGSIIHSPKNAGDIDLLGVVSNKRKFLDIDDSVRNIQKTQLKKIHLLNFTPSEFKRELEKPNKSFVDSLKKGVVLFGQEKFIKFVRSINKK
ncbi:MAG: hypothetical protein KKC75_08410 [Nanoarchaeota archaeon]|nr:hypothetical protein [Nanoarchaeota archaeon]MBU1004494.1 hypothetical protein [Nanoarchaeota archaeon]MBU1945664.1 hypothetical protein [Nanoarchaeota archaeon]